MTFAEGHLCIVLYGQADQSMAPSCALVAAKGTAAGSTAQYEEPAASYPSKSCICFSKDSAVRKFCTLFINSQAFDNFILFIILSNCVTLALSSPRQDFDSTRLGETLAFFDYVYIGVFTVEMLLKVIAMGFVFGKGTYLRDGWNVLDFLVVILGYVSLLSPSNLTAIRAFRAMRPLRAINRVKGMKVLVNTMLSSLPMLFDVFLLCAFTFFVFSLIAVQLFQGVLRNRCGFPDLSGAYNGTVMGSGGGGGGVIPAGGGGGGGLSVLAANVSYLVPEDQTEDLCSGPLSSEVIWHLGNDGTPTADAGKPYAGRACDSGMYCTWYGNPYNGFVSYDNILWSWLTIFQHITLSGWSDVMYLVMEAVNYWVWIFYVGLVIFGAFFMVNLALAVLAVNFSAEGQQASQEEVQNRQQDKEGRKRRRLRQEDGKEKEEEEKEEGEERRKELRQQQHHEQQHQEGEAYRRSSTSRRFEAALAAVGLPNGEGISTTSRLVAALKVRRRALLNDEDAALAGSHPPPSLGRMRRLAWRVAVSKGLELTTAALILVNTVVLCINWYGMTYKVEQATNYINYGLTCYFAVDVAIRLFAFGFARFFCSGLNIFDFLVVALSLAEMIIDLLPGVAGLGPLSVLRAFRLLRLFRLARNWRELNALLTGMFKSVKASIMLVGLMFLFLFVAALVGMQLFGYKFMFCDYVDGARPVCPLGQRVWGQCPNHFHCYLPCSEDQLGTWLDAPGSFYNGLAYCERFCANTDVAAAAADNAISANGNTNASNATSSSSVSGGARGGCEYLAMVGKSQVPRANFDNVFWGTYSVFQVLTGENWNDIMIDAMRAVSPWASLYFVGVILIGNYLVFNLFIAILLDNLNSKVLEAAAAVAAAAAKGSSSSNKFGKRPPSSRSSATAATPTALPPSLPMPTQQLDWDEVADEAAAFTRNAGDGSSGGGGGAGNNGCGAAAGAGASDANGNLNANGEAFGLSNMSQNGEVVEVPSLRLAYATSRQGLRGVSRRWDAEEEEVGPSGPPGPSHETGAAMAAAAPPPPLAGATQMGSASFKNTLHQREEQLRQRSWLSCRRVPCSSGGAPAGEGSVYDSTHDGSSGGGTTLTVSARCSAGGSPEGISITSMQSSGFRIPLPPVSIADTAAAAASGARQTGAESGGSAGGNCSPPLRTLRRVPSSAAAPAVSVADAEATTSGAGAGTSGHQVRIPPLAAAIAAVATVTDGTPTRAGPVAEAVEVPGAAPMSEGDSGGSGGAGIDFTGMPLLGRSRGTATPSSPLPPAPFPLFPPSSPTRSSWKDSTSLPTLQAPISASFASKAAVGATPCVATGRTWSPNGSNCGGRMARVEPSLPDFQQPSPSSSPSQQQQQLRPLPSQERPSTLFSALSSSRSAQPLQQLQPSQLHRLPSTQQQEQSRQQQLGLIQRSIRAAAKAFRNVLYGFSSFRTPVNQLSRAASNLSAVSGVQSSGEDGGSPIWVDDVEGRSLLLFTPENRLRCGAAAVVHDVLFEAAILLLILASCVCLVLDAPSLDPESRLALALRILDYIFTGAFTLEAVLKIVTFGFAFTGKKAYIRNGWNVLDLLIVMLGWALIVVELVGRDGVQHNVKMLRVLRALRALRPLRVVHRFPGLRVVVNTLFAVLPAMANVALVCVFFYLIFAILAVNLFKGKLYNCVDAASGERIDPYYTLPDGQELTRAWCEAGTQAVSQSAYFSALNVSMPEYSMVTQWLKPKANFDNVGVAMLTLFQTATLSLWVDITFTAVDAVAVDKQPLWNHNPWMILFFVAFILVCSFFVLNLFIGVTLDKFAELHAERDAEAGAFLTPQQQSWVQVQRLLLRSKVPYVPPRPAGRLRGAVYSSVSSRNFEVFMLLSILVNVMFIALVHTDMSATWQAVMSYSNLVFTCIFVVEAVLKVTAFGPRPYFRDGWNCFDCFVAAVSAVSVALDFSGTRDLSFMPVLRVLRVVRVIRLVRQATGMRKLLHTLITSLPALANVGGVMLLFFFIFAVIGVNLFAGIKHGDNLNRHANFDTLPNALLLLVRMITGEGWDAIMQDCMDTDDCVLVLQDFNVTIPSSPPTSLLPSSTSSLANLTTAAITLVTAGTYLDPSDPLLAALPSDAVDSQCPFSPFAAVLYFPVFVVLCTFILLQLVIAVLRENLLESDDGGDEAEAARPVPRTAVESFTKAWSAAVAEAAAPGGDGGCNRGGGGGGGRDDGGVGGGGGLLHASQLLEVLAVSRPPLGARGSDHPRQEVQRLLLRLRVPLYEGNKVSFMETLHALAGSVCATPLPPPTQEKLHRKISKRLPKAQPHAKYTAAHYHAANSVAAAVRGFLVRYNLRKELAAWEPGTEEDVQQQQQQP